MGNLILNNEAVYLENWQTLAALNTAPGYWPPRPVNPNRPYLFRFYLPLEGARDLGQLDSEYLQRVHGAPAQGAILLGLEALKPSNDGAILYAFDSAPVNRGPGIVDPAAPGAWAHYFGEEAQAFSPTWAARFHFELFNVEAKRISQLTDMEAIPMGLIGIYTYMRGSGLPMIKDAWDRGMLIDDLKYDRDPIVLAYTVKRVK
jgi:hypothetical protein